MKEELCQALLVQLAKLTDAVRRVEERLPPLTAAQRSARYREMKKTDPSRHGPVTQFSEEHVTQESRTEAPPLPVPSPLSPTPPILSPFIPLPLEKKPLSASADVVLVFEHWRKVHGRPDSKLTEERSKRVKAMLKAGYSVERLFRAIDGCAKDAFSMGHNDRGSKFNDLALICRDGTHVEKFEALAPQPRGPSVRRVSDQEAEEAALRDWEAKHG